MSAIRGYIDTVGSTISLADPIHDRIRTAVDDSAPYDYLLPLGAKPQDIPKFRTDQLGAQFRVPMHLAFAGRLPFLFLDARLVRGGDAEATEWLAQSHASGVVRLTRGTFVAFKSGLRDGPYDGLEGVFAAAGLHLTGIAEQQR